MYRLIPVLIAVVVLAALTLAFLVIVPAVRRRDARLAREAIRRDRLDEYQQRGALEDLELTRRRINTGQDDYYENRRQAEETP